jgi:hypothetical protein
MCVSTTKVSQYLIAIQIIHQLWDILAYSFYGNSEDIVTGFFFFLVVLGFEFSTSHLLGRHYTNCLALFFYTSNST